MELVQRQRIKLFYDIFFKFFFKFDASKMFNKKRGRLSSLTYSCRCSFNVTVKWLSG